MFFVCQQNSFPRATWKVKLDKIWILMHCVEGKSYQGTTQRDAVKGLLSRIYITVLCVANDLYPGITQIATWRVLLDWINISVWWQNYFKKKVWRGKSKIAKSKGTNNFKPKVKKVKFFKALKHINTQYLAHFVIRCCLETKIRFLMSFKTISRNWIGLKIRPNIL